MDTGTLAPLVNQREYTETEQIVLLHFFTNVDKNIYCATNNMSSQLWSFLVGQYSRSKLSMRDRFLKLFEEQKNALERGDIGTEEYISIEELAQSIKSGGNKKLKFFEDKASAFLQKWGVDYGHSSLKDADRIRFAIEGVSQVFTKVIESPFPPLGDFQEKSTRYLSFDKEGLIVPSEVKNSKYGNDIMEVQKKLMDVYQKFTPIVKEQLKEQNIINQKDFSSDRAFERTLDAKTFDIVRYLLPSNISTCLGASFSTRILEGHLSWMLSSPLEEVRLIAQSMYEEGLKLSPGLLSHVGVNDYEISKRKKLREKVQGLVSDKKDSSKIYKGINDQERVNIVFDGNLDEHILASIVFESSRKEGISYQKSLETVQGLSSQEKQDLMHSALGDRGKYDRMPRALQHSTVLVEFLLDFGAYRDIQRHRASKQLRQGSSAIHGYDYPEYIDLPGLEGFKKEYDQIMSEVSSLSHKVAEKNPYLLEYCAALGHLVRTSFEMDPGQLAYVIELRTTPQGHHSYRNLFLHLYKQIFDLAPIFAKYIRAGGGEESSRRIQEEKAEQKRKKLGI